MVTLGKIDEEACDQRNASSHSPVCILATIAANDNAMVSVASPMDSTNVMNSDARRDASNRRARMRCSTVKQTIAAANDDLSPASVQSSRNSSKRAEIGVKPSKSGTAQCGPRTDAHRHWLRIVGRQRIRDLPRPLPPQVCRRDVAAGRPRACAHVPPVRAMQITGCFEMLGDQRGVRVVVVDSRSQPPVHLGGPT